MSGGPHHDPLKEELEELRSFVTRPGSVPDFDAMMARARAEAAVAPVLEVVDGGAGTSGEESRRLLLTRVGGWASLVTAAAAAGLLLVNPGGGDPDAEFEALVVAYATDAAAGAWTSPTSRLLELPGVDLGGVPSFSGATPNVSSGGADDADGRDS